VLPGLHRPRIRQSKRSGDLEGAIADLVQAIALEPQDAIAYYNRDFGGRTRGLIMELGAPTAYETSQEAEVP